MRERRVDYDAVREALAQVAEDREKYAEFREQKRLGSSHILRGVKRDKTPLRAVWFDCETKPVQIDEDTVEQQFWFCCANYCRMNDTGNLTIKHREKKTFFEPVEFGEWLAELPTLTEPLYVFAHNAEFDVQVSRVMETLTALGWRSSGIGLHSNGKTFLLNAIKQHGAKQRYEIRFVSTTNYFPFSLAALGESFGVPKLASDVRDENGELDYSAPFEVWEEYCLRDVDIIERAVLHLQNFVRKHKLGSFPLTGSSMAFNALRQRTSTLRVDPRTGRKLAFTPFVIHRYPAPLELEFDSYFGGRSEALKVGKFEGEFFKLDINSMYPSIMASKPLPCRLENYSSTVEPMTEKLRQRMLNAIEKHNAGYIARVKLTVPRGQERYVKKLDEGQTVYPVGTFETVLGPESVRVALERGHIVEMGERCMYYMNKESEKFVKLFWKLRLEAKRDGNKVQEMFCKLALNSCYGKTGQRNEIINQVNPETLPDDVREEVEQVALEIGVPVTDLETGERTQLYTVLGTLFEKQLDERVPGSNSFPFFASAVTDYGRNILFDLFEKAGLSNVYYCDTDSVIVNREGYDALVAAGLVFEPMEVKGKTLLELNRCYPLGGLTLEGTAERIEIHGSKDYVFGGEWTIKGIRVDDEYDETTDSYLTEQWQSIKRNVLDGAVGVIVKKVRKKLHRVYYKRRLLADGSTEAWDWDFDEWEVSKKVEELRMSEKAWSRQKGNL